MQRGKIPMTVQSEARMVGLAQGAGAIVLLAVLAQIWPGWQLDSKATEDIAAARTAGYISAQGPACAALFLAQPDADAKLAVLKATTGTSAQKDLIPVEWRTLPGERSVNYTISDICLKGIVTSDQTSAQK